MRKRTLIGLLGVAGLVMVTLWLGLRAAPVPGWIPAVVLAAWIAVSVGGVWYLLRAAPLRYRLVVWVVLILLLLGMVLPPEWLQTVQQWVSQRLGRVPGMDMGSTAPMLAHVGLYAAFAGSLLWARGERHPAWVLLALAGFAVATELMQLLVEGRHADPGDVALNLSGVAAGALIAWAMARFQRRVGPTQVAEK